MPTPEGGFSVVASLPLISVGKAGSGRTREGKGA
jgi:hypothetical protein